jgi:hypothetical protein
MTIEKQPYFTHRSITSRQSTLFQRQQNSSRIIVLNRNIHTKAAWTTWTQWTRRISSMFFDESSWTKSWTEGV